MLKTLDGSFVPMMKARDHARLPKGMAGQDLFADPRWWAEPKEDGHRLQLHVDGMGRVTHAYSTLGHDVLGSPGLAFLRAAHLRPFAAVPLGCPVALCVEGELVLPRGTSSDVGSARAGDGAGLVLRLFEVLGWQGASFVDDARVTYEARRRALTSLGVWLAAQEVGGIEVLPIARTEAEKRRLLTDTVAGGGEGVLLKRLDAPYEAGKRRLHWIKWKSVDTWDAVIVDAAARPTRWRVRPGKWGRDGVFYADGRETETWKAGYANLRYGFYDGGRLRVAGTLGHSGPPAELAALVGRVAEIKGYGVYATGAIRHPGLVRFRDDKRAEDCTLADALLTGVRLQAPPADDAEGSEEANGGG
jgi:hypothetical protein